jgi:large subunit ribosomal protein L4
MKREEEIDMAKVALLNQKAENVGEIELNDAVFAIEPNNQAIFDMVLLQRASLRQGTHKVKGRSEVRGGGKKPWRQKGTGRARQGSTRAPQWVGGGTVFGPTPRSYKFKLNRKVRRLALRSALSQKLIDNEFTALNDLAFDSIKTKNMKEVMTAFNTPRKALVVVDELNDNVALSARNLSNVKLIDAKHVNVYDILDSTNLFMTEAAIKAVEEVLA